jgi:hypothetical protein
MSKISRRALSARQGRQSFGVGLVVIKTLYGTLQSGLRIKVFQGCLEFPWTSHLIKRPLSAFAVGCGVLRIKLMSVYLAAVIPISR